MRSQFVHILAAAFGMAAWLCKINKFEQKLHLREHLKIWSNKTQIKRTSFKRTFKNTIKSNSNKIKTYIRKTVVGPSVTKIFFKLGAWLSVVFFKRDWILYLFIFEVGSKIDKK